MVVVLVVSQEDMCSVIVARPLGFTFWSNAATKGAPKAFISRMNPSGNAAQTGAIRDGMRVQAINGKDVSGLDTAALKLLTSSVPDLCWVKAWVDNYGYHSAQAPAPDANAVLVQVPAGMQVVGSPEVGFFVTECDPAGNAAQAGVSVGMKITHVNEHDLACSTVVRTETDLASAIAESKSDGFRRELADVIYAEVPLPMGIRFTVR